MKICNSRSGEGPEATQRLPDRDARQDSDEHRRLALPEADRGPDEGWCAQECEWKCHEPEVREAFTEHCQPDERRGAPQGGDLEQTSPRQGRPPVADPEDQEGGKDQSAARVTEPPGEPDLVEVAPRRVTSERKAGDADGRADGAAQQGGEPGKLEDVLAAVERPRPVGVAIDEKRGEQPFQRVARGDPERGRHRAGRADVHDECARKDRGPDAVPERQKRRERDPRRGPDGRGASVDEREREAELAGDDIEAEERGQRERIFAIGEHRKRCAPSLRLGPLRFCRPCGHRALLWPCSETNASPIPTP